MKVGLALPQLGPQATRENLIRVSKEAEHDGFDSLWVIERLLWPLNPQTPYLVAPDGSLPTVYKNIFDSLAGI